MTGVFAGIYDASGGGGARDVARAVEGTVETSGPLAVAAPGLTQGRVLCFLEGRITDAAALRRSLDLPGPATMRFSAPATCAWARAS